MKRSALSLSVFHTRQTKHHLCTLSAVLSPRKGWSSSTRQGLRKFCLHSGHNVFWNLGNISMASNKLEAEPTTWGVCIPGHLCTAPKASWLNWHTLTPDHLTEAEVSYSTSHSQPPHQHQSHYKKLQAATCNTQSNSCHTGLVPQTPSSPSDVQKQLSQRTHGAAGKST